MIYSLLVLSSPASGHTAQTAAEFALRVLARGHCIHRIFFQDAGVECAAANSVYPQDEASPLDSWRILAEEHDVELSLCIASALRYGMLDQVEADRYERAAVTVHPLFTLVGLGQLVDACANSDRLITFGG